MFKRISGAISILVVQFFFWVPSAHATTPMLFCKDLGLGDLVRDVQLRFLGARTRDFGFLQDEQAAYASRPLSTPINWKLYKSSDTTLDDDFNILVSLIDNFRKGDDKKLIKVTNDFFVRHFDHPIVVLNGETEAKMAKLETNVGIPRLYHWILDQDRGKVLALDAAKRVDLAISEGSRAEIFLKVLSKLCAFESIKSTAAMLQDETETREMPMYFSGIYNNISILKGLASKSLSNAREAAIAEDRQKVIEESGIKEALDIALFEENAALDEQESNARSAPVSSSSAAGK